MLLDAIERVGRTAAASRRSSSNTTITDGILGDFEIDENGDTTLGTVSVYQVKSGEETFVKASPRSSSFVEGRNRAVQSNALWGRTAVLPRTLRTGDEWPRRRGVFRFPPSQAPPGATSLPVFGILLVSPPGRLAPRQPRQDAERVLPPLPDRTHERCDLRARRARLLARLRHPRADQLRPRRRVHARRHARRHDGHELRARGRLGALPVGDDPADAR